ncbi:MAG: aspartyl/asparaginyl beta-hydroxylase domain-containing protein [Pseudomonadota bacterium]
MKNSDLIAEADQAFATGELQVGLEKLREHCASQSADAGSWNRLAVIEEQIGDWSLAGRAHRQCIAAAPHIAASYVYAGYWFENDGNTDAAASAYSLAQECDPASLTVRAGHSAPANMRAQAGNTLLRQFLSNHHRELFADKVDCERIQEAIWPLTHDANFDYSESQFAPNLFYIPGLEKKPYYAAEQFDWSGVFTAGTNDITSELAAALEQKVAQSQLRPYLPENSISEGPLKELAGSLEWTALDLFKDGVENTDTSSLFPKTMALLDQVPLYALGEQPFEVFFSLLKPGQEIAPHYGQSNHALTVHLALDVPPDCYLEVAGEQRQWQRGELLIFDDSFLHSAHNQSSELRIVLIFSVWQPSLSSAEQEAIRLSFETRRDWMNARVGKLEYLLGHQAP